MTGKISKLVKIAIHTGMLRSIFLLLIDVQKQDPTIISTYQTSVKKDHPARQLPSNNGPLISQLMTLKGDYMAQINCELLSPKLNVTISKHRLIEQFYFLLSCFQVSY